MRVYDSKILDDENNALQKALDDYSQVNILNPGESNVEKMINKCKKAISESGLQHFTNQPPSGVHTPKAQRHADKKTEEATPPQQKKYVELGGNGSPFMRYKEPPKSPRRGQYVEPVRQHLKQPGRK